MLKSILKSLGYAFIIVLFPTLAGVFIDINKVTAPFTVVAIQSVMFFLAGLLGFFLYRKRSKIEGEGVGLFKVLYFVPIIMVELPALSQGIREDFSLKLFLLYFMFTLFIGIAEEIFFRGLILSELSNYGKIFGIIVSALIFGIFHSANLLDGANVFYTLLQMAFAVVFGLVAAEVVLLRGSLLPVILWHFVHNFFSYIGTGAENIGGELTTMQLTISFVQFIILALYATYLFKIVQRN